MGILNGLLYAKCLTKNMTCIVSYILNSSVGMQFINTKTKQKKSMLTMTYTRQLMKITKSLQ